ncbi:probable inactive ATP-dependent zinc metalloprotease FTSHI 5, chloroplastic [Actinidia eriantha]|uniref:probable inactive ATP-dependent zinc metalloprotease FTSHI 5, chloroplastic n=1 Tax=Actinidia eriantha TaxID=165200 RepID=UPI00258EEDF6|nr:probable inactive ATP-dependent zinc metalloprotease FTSHI 5, chloroplastic [Actinidia eriantha]
MYFSLTCSPCSLSIPLVPLLPSSDRNSIFNFCSFPPKQHRYGRPPIRRFSIKSSQNPLRPPPIFSVKFPQSSSKSTNKQQKPDFYDDENSVLKCIAKPIVYTLFCIAIGLFSLCRGPAIAATPVAVAIEEKERERKDVVMEVKDHQYSNFTRRLLQVVSVLLRRIEQVRLGKGDLNVVDKALRKVKLTREKLQEEIMSGLYADVKKSKNERQKLVKQSGKVLNSMLKAKRERDKVLRRDGDKAKERIAKLEDMVHTAEKEYARIWESIGKIEDRNLRTETMALSIGVRELSFIERESETLVEKLRQEKMRQGHESAPKSPLTKLSRADIQNELQSATRQFWEQMILPSVLEAGDIGFPFDQESIEFAERIKQALEYSREMQSNLEAGIRTNMSMFGDEKRFIVNTPVDEVVKGFPEVELKWMFGRKEVVVPKAVGLHLFHGWKKWREESKAELKKNLLENVDFGKKYVAEKQERVLLDRDRLASKTWYNEERNRWEMDPMAIPYAVSRKLVENARIRHDWAAMYIALKGDDKEYFVDIKEFEILFENFGGFDGLYLRMLASGIPTAVQLMWIPFSDLDFHQQFLLIMRLSQRCLSGLWNAGIVSDTREWILEEVRYLNEDILATIVFPILDFIIFLPERMQLGEAWLQFTYWIVGSKLYSNWQSLAQERFGSGKKDDILWLFVRSFVYGYVLFHIFRFLKRKVSRLLGYGPLHRDPNLQKLRRVKAYVKYKVKRTRLKKKSRVDPIRTAFDQMKRVKNPPIPLKDFASVECMREEINEVVAFLQNPRAFQEMGARAPRGVLIVGERGTGKTSLALAIAAEAKVPLVEVKAQQLEAGQGIGQGASNVRELFQTARDLAPVIIFVEDFDLFAGVRGKFIHTKKQDHEAFINQLLVELDGFEKQDGVVLMATTRNLKQIDEALKRPGRMDRIFHLQRPTQTEREKILQKAAKETMDEELIDFVDWRKVAEKTALLFPTELKLVPMALEGSAFRGKYLDKDELMCYVSWFATFSGIIPNWVRKTKIMKLISKMLVNHLGLTLTREDLQQVVDLMEPYGEITNGIELLSPPIEWTRETKFPHAVWAAGRGLITLLLPNFDVVHNLWLEPCSWEGIGCIKITKAGSEDSSRKGNVESRSYLEKKLVFCFGSYVAAHLLLPFGEENILSSSDLKQAQGIATRMVIQCGWGPDDSPTIYHHRTAVTTLSMGNNHEYEIAAKVGKMYDLAYDKAKKMLQNNRRVLERIVEELLEFDVLTGKDLERIILANGGIREKEPFFLSDVHEEPVFSSILENGNVSGAALSSPGN